MGVYCPVCTHWFLCSRRWYGCKKVLSWPSAADGNRHLWYTGGESLPFLRSENGMGFSSGKATQSSMIQGRESACCLFVIFFFGETFLVSGTLESVISMVASLAKLSKGGNCKDSSESRRRGLHIFCCFNTLTVKDDKYCVAKRLRSHVWIDEFLCFCFDFIRTGRCGGNSLLLMINSRQNNAVLTTRRVTYMLLLSALLFMS
eukprot:scaffold22055_cov163-Amphora_coffeaeformis.AAC.2